MGDDTMTGVNALCVCGHAKKDHIYHEGACRPGFVCPEECEYFTPVGITRKSVTAPRVTDDPEPRIGWHQSIERNRLDAMTLLVIQQVEMILAATDATEKVSVDVRDEFKRDMQMAFGYLNDAQRGLKGAAL